MASYRCEGAGVWGEYGVPGVLEELVVEWPGLIRQSNFKLCNCQDAEFVAA